MPSSAAATRGIGNATRRRPGKFGVVARVEDHKVATPQRRAVSAICARASAARVQTLSAEKRPAGRPSFANASPITACEEPYMGEESTMPPPASKKAAMTARHSARSSGSSPTLKVIQLPMPIAGTGSPLAGMRLGSTSAAEAPSVGAASAAPAPTSTARRVNRMRRSSAACVAQH